MATLTDRAFRNRGREDTGIPGRQFVTLPIAYADCAQFNLGRRRTTLAELGRPEPAAGAPTGTFRVEWTPAGYDSAVPGRGVRGHLHGGARRRALRAVPGRTCPGGEHGLGPLRGTDLDTARRARAARIPVDPVSTFGCGEQYRPPQTRVAVKVLRSCVAAPTGLGMSARVGVLTVSRRSGAACRARCRCHRSWRAGCRSSRGGPPRRARDARAGPVSRDHPARA